MTYEWTDINDWRIEQMRELGLDQERMKQLLREAVPGASNFKVRILEPGLSGFQVLHIHFQKSGSGQSAILKLRRYHNEIDAKAATKGEERVRRDLLLQPEASHLAVPMAHSEIVTWPKSAPEEYWLCMLFRDATTVSTTSTGAARYTFKQYFADRFLDNEIDISREAQKVRNVLESYRKLPFLTTIEHTRPWSTALETVKPLAQRQYLATYRNNLWYVFTHRHDLAASLEIKRSDIHHLLEFIDTGVYLGEGIDPSIVDVPIAQVHGDLNGGNVLVSRAQTDDVVFIDLGQMSENPDHHALFDIGKLSVEFERFILPESVFDHDCLATIHNWCDTHNLWIQDLNWNANPCATPEEARLLVLYELLSVFRDFSVEYCESFGIEDIAVCKKHFLYARLHHLLRMINHPYVTTPRKLFAIKASTDILRYLTGDPRSVSDGDAPKLYWREDEAGVSSAVAPQILFWEDSARSRNRIYPSSSRRLVKRIQSIPTNLLARQDVSYGAFPVILERLDQMKTPQGIWQIGPSRFDQIYATTSVLYLLLQLGLTEEDEIASPAFEFLDSVTEISIETRAKWFFYLITNRCNEPETVAFLNVLAEAQFSKDSHREMAGSFLFAQGDKEDRETIWRKNHRFGVYFHALHVADVLLHLDGEKKAARKSAVSILTNIPKFPPASTFPPRRSDSIGDQQAE